MSGKDLNRQLSLFHCKKQKKKAFISRSHLLYCALSLFLIPLLVANAKGQGDLAKKPFLPEQVHAISTIPSNGDLNHYGVAFVSDHPTGLAKTGDILVSNFNNNQNLQGTGSTILDQGRIAVLFVANGLTGTALRFILSSIETHDLLCFISR